MASRAGTDEFKPFSQRSKRCSNPSIARTAEFSGDCLKQLRWLQDFGAVRASQIQRSEYTEQALRAAAAFHATGLGDEAP